MDNANRVLVDMYLYIYMDTVRIYTILKFHLDNSDLLSDIPDLQCSCRLNDLSFYTVVDLYCNHSSLYSYTSSC